MVCGVVEALDAVLPVNASLQFNATNQQQVDTFMAGLKNQVDTNNATRSDATSQFNTQLAQQRAALDAGNEMQASQLNAQIGSQIDQFNAQLDFNSEQFNAQNQTAINQANATWRRQLNTANNAGENSVNQANAMNAFNMSNQALTFMWQEMRDSADWASKLAMTDIDAKTRLGVAALGNEAASDSDKKDLIISMGNLAVSIFNEWD
jgi:exonuclease VII large subunit